MADQGPQTVRKAAVRQRPDAAEKPRPVLSFRVHADLHARLKASTEANGYALSEEVERRLMRSFEMEEQLATLTEFRDLVNQREARLWPDETVQLLGTAFALTLAEVQQRDGKGWRESETSATVTAETIRTLMTKHCRYPTLAGLTGTRQVEETVAAISASVGAFLDQMMPALPEPKLPTARWTNRVRLVTTFRDRTSGDVLQSVVGPEFDHSDPEDRPENPALTAALNRFRASQHQVDVEVSLSFAMQDGKAIWETLSDPEVAEAAFRVTAPKTRTAIVRSSALLPSAAASDNHEPEQEKSVGVRRGKQRPPRAAS